MKLILLSSRKLMSSWKSIGPIKRNWQNAWILWIISWTVNTTTIWTNKATCMKSWKVITKMTFKFMNALKARLVITRLRWKMDKSSAKSYRSNQRTWSSRKTWKRFSALESQSHSNPIRMLWIGEPNHNLGLLRAKRSQVAEILWSSWRMLCWNHNF